MTVSPSLHRSSHAHEHGRGTARVLDGPVNVSVNVDDARTEDATSTEGTDATHASSTATSERNKDGGDQGADKDDKVPATDDDDDEQHPFFPDHGQLSSDDKLMVDNVPPSPFVPRLGSSRDKVDVRSRSSDN